MKVHKSSPASNNNKNTNRKSNNLAKVAKHISYNGGSSTPFMLDDNLLIADDEPIDDAFRFMKNPLMHPQEQNNYGNDEDDSSTITSMQNTTRKSKQTSLV